MNLNEAGHMLESVWRQLPERFQPVRLDSFIVMPNHLHAIIIVNNGDLKLPSPRSRIGKQHVMLGKGSLFTVESPASRTPTRGVPTEGCTALSDVVGAFKSMTTVNDISGVKKSGWPPFHYKLWQADYYDRVIRSGDELGNVRNYIVTNPLRWMFDRENPNRRPSP